MEYLSCSDASKAMGFSVRRIQQMCKNGELPGAIKEGRKWLIPDETMHMNHFAKNKSLPIGVSDFKLATTGYYYVDKTLMIRDFLDKKPMVSLFTRPRRFGKTLNMDMLRVFFEKTNEDTSVYFKDKQIWQCGDYYTKHQGQYPVIFLTFKDVKSMTWEETFQKIRRLISLEFIRHNELETSSVLTAYEKEQYHLLAKDSGDEVDCQMGLQLLSLLLHKHYGRECIIIIDEYDTPIQQGHTCNFYPEIVNFMRNFFSGGLKDNPHLAFGFLTGILRVAKESIFSGMNNLKTYSILDDGYSSYFGFTEKEVKDMLRYYGKDDKYNELSEWYDGYRFGNTEIFNPWSVINYISDNCFPKAFWQSTGSNEIIGEIIQAATPEITKGLYKLLCGEKIAAYIDTGVIYPEVQNNPYSIYSFLLVAGYLKVANIYPQSDGNFMCDVAIPNKEITFVYEKEVLNRTNQNSLAISISQAIFSKDTQKLQALLEDFMVKSISSIDGANEGFYHGMMLGLCAILGNRYKIRSNRESGLGRFDIQLMPLTKGMPGFIFEFKHTKDEHTDLSALADSALQQIEAKKYDTELRDNGVNSIISIGIAFRGKSAVVRRG
ncbi:AAA family ATPase [[Eubacterium] rectale]|uniref:AAA family ATPase n=1 Tax=Agathobacter rectalis TaxID=39491 RepID=A0AAP2QGA0_9FIRM|nr:MULTISPECIES: AAA family ATPase [Agathobacter]MCB6945373.1 AAA family ATPase [Agathobacter rectalis]MCB6961778.1 AAA family ATPase [Agathobacter rectalis]MDB8014424.1 AAA family ATPase [Agathobacter rectalis]MDB8018083.1 AAA family ATPase [Agathobacter rectalis]MDB8020826.1 AAA family ATPase [Agathobacter rectalis]